MNQLGLFDPRRFARTDDPATSHAAAHEARSLRGVHHRLILEILGRGEALNADQIADRSGGAMDRVQVGKRLPELLDARMVELSGGVAPSHSGRAARCYRIPAEAAVNGSGKPL